MCYQTLSFVECLEILRQAKAVHAAFFDGHAPYVVPMGFEWFVNGMQPVVLPDDAEGGPQGGGIIRLHAGVSGV